MRDSPARLAIIGILGAVAMIYNVYVYTGLWTQPGTGAPSPSAAPARAARPESEAEEEEVGVPRGGPVISGASVQRRLDALPETDRNPFRFAAPRGDGGERPESSELVLQGTLVGGRRIAWINQRALAEGERIQGHEIARIERGRVLLQRGAETIELRGSR